MILGGWGMRGVNTNTYLAFKHLYMQYYSFQYKI
jgi:hypothetical protein